MKNTRLDQLFAFLEANPSDPFLRYAIATEYIKLGDDDKALTYFSYLQQHHPDYVGTYYHLAKLYQRKERFDDALLTYTAGIAVCRTQRDQHALSELMNAKNELEYELED